MRRNAAQSSDLEADIIKRIRTRNGISRVELARDLGLAPSTAGIYVERLISNGYLTETEKVARNAGRPPVLLRPNPEGGEFIGVDFEARHVMAVSVDFSDKPLRNAHRQIEEGDSVTEVIGKIEAAVAAVLPRDTSRVLAIGVGVPGIVDSSRGVAVHYRYIPHWQDVPLAARLTKRFRVPVFLENNARSMALAELWFGQGRGETDFLCIGIRSGIGVGMVLEGQLYCGAHHTAGELGRWRGAVAHADSGAPGQELQEIASARAIQQALKKAISSGKKTVLKEHAQPISFEHVVRAAQQRDVLTLRVIGEAAHALASAIAHLTLVVDPAKIVIAGPLTMLGDVLLHPLQSTVNAALQASGLKAPEIVYSTMGEFSGALGAAALAVHEWTPAPGQEAGAPVKKAKISPGRAKRA